MRMVSFSFHKAKSYIENKKKTHLLIFNLTSQSLQQTRNSNLSAVSLGSLGLSRGAVEPPLPHLKRFCWGVAFHLSSPMEEAFWDGEARKFGLGGWKPPPWAVALCHANVCGRSNFSFSLPEDLSSVLQSASVPRVEMLPYPWHQNPRLKALLKANNQLFQWTPVDTLNSIFYIYWLSSKDYHS